jgi:hypothetical protein
LPCHPSKNPTPTPPKNLTLLTRFHPHILLKTPESLFDSMNTMTIPYESDWRSEPWGIDTPCAYEHFSGKTLDEAFDLFVKDSLYYQEDIMFMPVLCFRYYVHAYMNYLLSDKSGGDCDGASCFFGLIEVRKDDICTSADKLRNRISEVLHYIGARQE